MGARCCASAFPMCTPSPSDLLFPYLDLTFTLAFIPGIVLAMFGDYAIVGPMTLAVLPLNMRDSSIMYRRQRSRSGRPGCACGRTWSAMSYTCSSTSC